MIQIGVASVHFAYPLVDDDEFRRLAVLLYGAATEAARNRSSVSDIQIALDVEQGTIRARTRILATAAAVGMFLNQYGGIREGAKYLAEDVMNTGSWVVKRVVDRAGVSGNDIISSRRSATLTRRIRSILAKVELGEMSADTGTRQILELLGPDAEGTLPAALIQKIVADVTHTSIQSPPQPGGERRIHTPLVVTEKFSDELELQAPLPAPSVEYPRKPKRLRIYTTPDGRLRVDED